MTAIFQPDGGFLLLERAVIAYVTAARTLSLQAFYVSFYPGRQEPGAVRRPDGTIEVPPASGVLLRDRSENRNHSVFEGALATTSKRWK
jgi:hypothetical protein